MKNYQLFIGIDVSKSELSVCFATSLQDKIHYGYLTTGNTTKGIKQMISQIAKHGFTLEQTLVCFETTGVYSIPLSYHLSGAGIDYCMESALAIKRSLGIRRGKSDKADAKAIAEYCLKNQNTLTVSTLPEDILVELKVLVSEREKLIKTIKILKSSQETFDFLPKQSTRAASRINGKALSMLEKRYKEIEELISSKIKEDPAVKECFDLCCSVPGVGPQTATNLIICTGMFKRFINWRQMACYSGVAPFEFSSGSSIRGKTKVNHLANKKIKMLLSMGAIVAKRHSAEMREYYQRKIDEGKNKKLVLNAIRCKILSRVFAVVKRGTPYVDTYKFAA